MHKSVVIKNKHLSCNIKAQKIVISTKEPMNVSTHLKILCLSIHIFTFTV